MTRIAVLAAIAALGAVPQPGAARDGSGPAEVHAVSVLAAAGKVAVVVSLRGTAEVRDFTLSNPARLVLDVLGARLGSVGGSYDGTNRGGVRNVRCAQFRPDVVRVVVDLDALRDYQVIRGDSEVRVEFSTDGPASFPSWSTEPLARAAAPVRPPERAAPAESVLSLSSVSPPVQGGLEADTTATPDLGGDIQGGSRGIWLRTPPKAPRPKYPGSRCAGMAPISRMSWPGSPRSAGARSFWRRM